MSARLSRALIGLGYVARRCRSLAFQLLRFKRENVARLARERLADRVERGAGDAPPCRFKDREVNQRHSDPIRELGQRQPPAVEINRDRNHTVPFSRLRA